MFDGYDEIIDKEKRYQTSKILIDFMNEFDKCSYIITSSIYLYENERFDNIQDVNTLYLSPLSKEQMYIFLKRWRYPSEKSSMELYNRLINTTQMESIASNPLLLTMIVHVYCDSNFKFSNSKSQLYMECINCLLKKWDDEKIKRKRILRPNIVSADVKVKLLSMFANYLCENEINIISATDLANLFSKHPLEPSCFHGKSINIIDEIVNQSGILESDNNMIRFRHRTFYEYFIALYCIENNVDDLFITNNINSNQNIAFFYYSMIKDEEKVSSYICQNLNNTTLISQILIERKITSLDSLDSFFQQLLTKINYENIKQLQDIGYLALQYPQLISRIKQLFVNKIKETNNSMIKVNIIICLMLFCDEKFMKKILQRQIDFINLELLVQYAGETLDSFSLLIIKMISSKEKRYRYMELLALTYRFKSIYNIYLYGDDDERKYAIIGFLYMSNELELFKLLEKEGFCGTVDKNILIYSQDLLKKYGWAGDELKDNEKNCLFILISLYIKKVHKEKILNKTLINNRLAFLLSYIISELGNKINFSLINLDDIYIKSVVEFNYHWNIRKNTKNPQKSFVNYIGTNVKNWDFVISVIVVLVLFFQTFHFVYTYSKIAELFYYGYEINYNMAYNFGANIISLNFNVYIFFIMIFFLIYAFVNRLIRTISYSTFSILLTVLCGVIFILLYFLYVYNFAYRISILFAICFLILIENIKHKNNYPSFKEPQYSRIIKYLV